MISCEGLDEAAILIIDDNPTNLGIIVDYLEAVGFEVMVARTGESGLAIAQQAQPDLILLDILMPPGMNGVETCRRLKADPLTGDIPIIFMTALANIEDKIRGFEAGGVDYLTKPLQQEEALARVVGHLKIRDLTRRLQQANRELIKLNADKDRFLSIIAHDLRGPFAPLLSAAEWLMDMPELAELKEAKTLIDLIYVSGRRIADLQENLLEWSRIQLGCMVYHPTRLNVGDIFEQNIDLFSRNAAAKQIILQNYVSEEVWVMADPNMLNFIIRNLTSNAIKFTPSGGKVTFAAQRLAAPFVEITVTDTGVGLSQEKIEQLLQAEPFQSTLGTAGEKGTGLGLTVCREMIGQYKGQLQIESNPGQGTTVRFTVPC